MLDLLVQPLRTLYLFLQLRFLLFIQQEFIAHILALLPDRLLQLPLLGSQRIFLLAYLSSQRII